MISRSEFKKYTSNKPELLGTGGFGKVYKIKTSDSPPQIYAMKIIDIENVTGKYLQESPMKTPIRPRKSQNISEMKLEIWKSLIKEVKIMEKLKNHENIVTMYNYSIDKKKLYIIMEYSSYGSLLKYIKKQPHRRIPEFIARSITASVLNGLTYLANQSIIHGDLKAANILIFSNGDIKLCDFGLSFQWDDSNKDDYNDSINDNNSAHSNNIGRISVNGSAYWLAPEIIIYKMATPKSDIWSLGSTVIEMLTGKPPFSDYGPLPACHAIGSGTKIEHPDFITNDCAKFLDSCFQYDPIKRPRAKFLMNTPWIKYSIKNVLHNVEDITDNDKFDNYDDDFEQLMPTKKSLDSYKEKEGDEIFDNYDFEDQAGDYFDNLYKDLHLNTVVQLKQIPIASTPSAIDSLSTLYTSSFKILLKNGNLKHCEELLRIGQKYLQLYPKVLEELCFKGLLLQFSLNKTDISCFKLLNTLVIHSLGERGREWLIITGLLEQVD